MKSRPLRRSLRTAIPSQIIVPLPQSFVCCCCWGFLFVCLFVLLCFCLFVVGFFGGREVGWGGGGGGHFFLTLPPCFHVVDITTELSLLRSKGPYRYTIGLLWFLQGSTGQRVRLPEAISLDRVTGRYGTKMQ